MRFLVESTCCNDEFFLFKEAKDSIVVLPLLNPYFIQSFRVFKVLEINLWCHFKIFNEFYGPNNFLLNLDALSNKKVIEIGFVENYFSEFFTLFHANLIKFHFSATFYFNVVFCSSKIHLST